VLVNSILKSVIGAAGVMRSQLLRYRIRLFQIAVCLVAPLCMFAVLAEEVVEQEIMALDVSIMRALHAHASPLLDAVMLAASAAGSGAVLLPLNLAGCAVLLFHARYRHAAFLVTATGGTLLINMMAKHAFRRDRPALWTSISPEHSFGFPSGHAMNSMAVAAVLIVLVHGSRWQRITVAMVAGLVLLIALSRVYLGVHYPSDILAGWSATLVWVAALVQCGSTMFGLSRMDAGSR
jgi:membrane-associated phospholipid phosphatase